MSLYSVLYSKKNMLKFDQSDEAAIKGLYFDMNPMSVTLQTEPDENNGQNQNENVKPAKGGRYDGALLDV